MKDGKLARQFVSCGGALEHLDSGVAVVFESFSDAWVAILVVATEVGAARGPAPPGSMWVEEAELLLVRPQQRPDGKVAVI